MKNVKERKITDQAPKGLIMTHIMALIQWFFNRWARLVTTKKCFLMMKAIGATKQIVFFSPFLFYFLGNASEVPGGLKLTTVFCVEHEICSHSIRVETKLVQDVIKLHITSTCPRVQKYGERLRDISVKDLLKPLPSNPVYVAAHDLTPTCIVPCVVLNACWAEAGLISRNLLEKHPMVVVQIECKE